MLKFIKKSGKYAEKSRNSLWVQKPTTGRMAIKKNRSLKKWVGVFGSTLNFLGSLIWASTTTIPKIRSIKQPQPNGREEEGGAGVV